MRREYRATAGRLEGCIEVHIGVLVHHLTNTFQPKEPRVALVRMEDVRRRRLRDPTVRAKRTYATDSEQHLLLKPVFPAAAIQSIGHLAFGCIVLFDPRIQQQERHAPYARQPDSCEQRAITRQTHRNPRGCTRLLA